MKRFKKIIISIIFVILLISLIYINNYYHVESIEAFSQSSNFINVNNEDYGLSFKHDGNENAFIFHPGAKVEYTAYSELMYNLALKGIDCYLGKMPGNLAILGMNKADDIITNTNYKEYWWAFLRWSNDC